MKKILLSLFLLQQVMNAHAQTCTSSSPSNFNGTNIAAGKWIWFNAHIKLSNPPAGNFMVLLNNSQVTSGSFTLNIPSAKIMFSTTATAASYTFSANTWNITIPSASAKEDEIFLSGLAYQVPAGGLKGGINPVTWSGRFLSDANVSLSWQWSAAVYNNFSTNYNNADIVLLHDNADHAGTPLAYAYSGNSIGGARGGGASNYTGSWSGTAASGTCGVSNSPLPVAFKSFTATRDKQNITVKWQTATEQDSYGFMVQRMENGSWQDVAFIPSQAANGNSTSGFNYNYTELNNSKALTQYRIKQIEFSNTFRYSDIQAVIGWEQSGKLSIYPNPSADGRINLVFDGEGDRSIVVYDFTGRTIRQWKSIRAANLNMNLSKGSYFIKVIDEDSGNIQTEKVLVN